MPLDCAQALPPHNPLRAKTQLGDAPPPSHRINVVTYLVSTDEAGEPAEPSLQQMLNMRQQLEAKAKVDKMRARLSPKWRGMPR